MDFRGKGITWVGDICQKFETICLDVDDIVCEETFKYVENQLQTVGANVKQFCSEFVNDVLPPFSVDSMVGALPDLSLEQNKNTDRSAYETTNVGVEKDPKMGLCMVNSLPHASFVEPTEGVQIDFSLKQNAHIGMYEKTSMGVRENPVEEIIFPSEIPEALSLAEKDLSVASSFYCVNQSNHEEEWNVQVNLSAPRSIEGKNSSTQTEETSNLVATAEISGVLSSANSVILVQSCECKVLGSGLTSGDALSAEFNVSGIDTSAPNVIVSMAESSWVGFQLCDEFTETEDSMSFADSEMMDDAAVKEANDDCVIEPDLETTQPYNKPNVDESCIVVDDNELCCISLTAAKHQSYKKKIREVFASKMKKAKSQECEHQAPGYEDSDAESNQQEGDSLTPSVHARKYESANRDFCESEWEIV